MRVVVPQGFYCTSETEWRPTGNDSIGEMRGHVGVTRREDLKRSFVARNYPTG